MWKTSRTESAEQLLVIPTKLGAQAGLAEKHGKAWGVQQSPRQAPHAGCPTLFLPSPLARTFVCLLHTHCSCTHSKLAERMPLE